MIESGSLDARDNTTAPGTALRAARTAQNLSVGEVARQLRLSVKQVEALEAGAFERLPGQVFVRGFIRNYARLLKLDPEPLLREVAPPRAPDELEQPVDRAEMLPPRGTRRWMWYAIALLILVAVLAVHEFVLIERPQSVTAERPPAVSVPIMPAPPAKEPLAVTPPAPQDPGEIPREGGQGGTAETAAAPSASSESSVAPPPAPGESEILLNFERDSWVEIRDNSGRTIFSRLNRGGTEQRIRGRPPFVVVIGNARGVRLTYNDREVDLGPHMRYDVARLTLQ